MASVPGVFVEYAELLLNLGLRNVMFVSLEVEDGPLYVKRSSNNPLLLSLLQRKDNVYRSPC